MAQPINSGNFFDTHRTGPLSSNGNFSNNHQSFRNHRVPAVTSCKPALAVVLASSY